MTDQLAEDILSGETYTIGGGFNGNVDRFMTKYV